MKCPRQVPSASCREYSIVGAPWLAATLIAIWPTTAREPRATTLRCNLMARAGASKIAVAGTGPFFNGVSAPCLSSRHGVLAIGDTLLCDDVRPLLAQSIEVSDGIVIGPTLRRAWLDIERAVRTSSIVHLNGETGFGLELGSRRFQRQGRALAVRW